MHAIRYSAWLLLALLCACTRTPEPAPVETPAAEAVDPRLPSITVSGDESGAAAWNWQPPVVELAEDDIPEARRNAARALSEGRLYAEAGDAIPLYLALQAAAPEDTQVKRGLEKSLAALLKQGDAALRDAGDSADALSRAGEIAAVARTLAADDEKVVTYLARVDTADQLWRLNAAGERALRSGEIGERGELA